MTNLKSEIPVSINIKGKIFLLDLDEEPLILGKDVDDLPSLVMNIFSDDDQISGKHCQIWYGKADNCLHITSFSTNTTTVNGELLDKGKGKAIAVKDKFDLVIGRTKINLVRQDTDAVKTPLSIEPNKGQKKPLVIDIPPPSIDAVKVSKSSSADVHAPAIKKSFVAALFRLEGRYGRLDYLKMMVGYSVISTASLVLMTISFDFLLDNIPYKYEDFAVVVFLIILGGCVIVTCVVGAFMIVKRFHDMGKSGAHYWTLLIPIYSIYISIILLFRKGDEGENRYGFDPLAK